MRYSKLAALLASLLLLAACKARGGSDSHSVPRPTGIIPVPTPACVPGPEPADWAGYPYRIDLYPGASASIEVHATRNGYCGPIDVSATGLPPTVHAETTPAEWPEDVATIHLQADSTLVDAIQLVGIGVWLGYQSGGELTLRTRAEPKIDWSQDVIGVPGTGGFDKLIWAGGSRIFASDLESPSFNSYTPVIRCFDVGVGPCPDFGTGGTVRLDAKPYWPRAVFDRAADGSFIVAEADWISPGQLGDTTWSRLTPTGEKLDLPSIDPIAKNTRVVDVALDSEGRILFIAEPKGKPTSYGLYRLKADGSRDESFSADAATAATIGMVDLHVLPDGRILADDRGSYQWLDADGTPLGPRIEISYAPTQLVLDDGNVLYGQYIGPDEEKSGSVELMGSSGTVLRHWDLGYHIDPIALSVDGPTPIVVATVNEPWGDNRSGVLRVISLDDEPSILVEQELGATVSNAWISNQSGSIRIAGSRVIDMMDAGIWWGEAFLWQLE